MRSDKVREAAGAHEGAATTSSRSAWRCTTTTTPRASFPPPDRVTGPNGKPGLSWRVHILPYIEQDALYKQFKLDEPWDSEHNKKLIEKMPKVYVSPLAVAPPGETYYQVFTGKDAIFDPGSKTQHRRDHRRHLEHDHDRRGRRAGDLDEAGRHPVRPARSTRSRLPLPGKTGINIGMARRLGALDGSEHAHPGQTRGRDHPRRRRDVDSRAATAPVRPCPSCAQGGPDPHEARPPKEARSKPPEPVKQ